MAKSQARTPPIQPSADRGSIASERTWVFWSASVLFVLSGATALVYEVIWFKRFSQLWGNSALAAAAVAAAFLFGLGMGALWIGRRADRARSPMRWYALSEAGVAILAVALPFEIGWLAPLGAVFYRFSGGYPLVLSLMRTLTTFVLLGPPCFLMGGTLPLLIRSFASSGAARDRNTAWFYAINTLGAATGCYLAGFHLLPSIGLAWTNGLAAAVDVAIAAVAILLSSRLAAREIRPLPAGQAQPGLSGPRNSAAWMINACAALAGCGALILQMVWTRQLCLILGGSTYAFSAMLFTVLIGIGLGSLICDVWFETSLVSSSSAAAASLIALALGASVALCERSILSLTYLVGMAGVLRSSQAFNGALSVAASALLELLPTLAMGLLLPILVSLRESRGGDAGQTVGEVYAANTLGCIVGALATPLLLIPYWGTSTATVVAVGLYGLAALLIVPARSERRQLARAAVIAAALAVMYASGFTPDPLITNAGMGLYGYREITESLLFFREGAAADVIVIENRDKERALRVNGKADAGTGSDMAAQTALAYVPRFLRPASTDVLVIGFGSGTTSGSALLFPGTRVKCLEIEPAVFEASAAFAQVNHNPERSPRFSIIFDDGRSYLQGTDEKFDQIVSEPSNPWMAGTSNLFTREYYLAAQKRLKPGGILAQWIQLYQLSPADYAMIVRTVMSVFPHASLLWLQDIEDTILVASDAPIDPGKAGLQAAQSLVDASPAVQADLQSYLGTKDVFSFLFLNLIVDENGLRRMVAAEGPPVLNTDLNLRLEFNAPRSLFTPDSSAQTARRFIHASEPSRFAREFEEWGGGADRAGLFGSVAQMYELVGAHDSAAKLVALGVAKDPHSPDLLALKLTLAPPDPRSFDEGLSAILASSENVANQLGITMVQKKRYEQAIEIFERLVALHPDSSLTWDNLAESYAGAGERAKAKGAFQKAISLDPFNAKFRQSYQASSAESPN